MADLDFYSANASLAGVERLDVPAMERIYQVERTGERFYELLAERVGNDEAAELLRRNGREELAHARRIAKAIEISLGHEWTPSDDIERILEVPLPDEIPVEVFKAVVKGELNGDVGYQKWADNEPNEDIAKLLRLNGREETIHANRVQDVIAILERV